MSKEYELQIINNLHNIKEGMIIKNYKELCKLLGMKTKAGKGKTIQLKIIGRFINLDKDGHKYIITEVYDEPLELIDGRHFSKRVANYIDELELLLLDLMVSNKKEVLSISKSKLKEALAMVNFNYNYYYASENRNKLALALDVDMRMINEYYQSSSGILNNALSTVLDRLERKNLIAKSEKKMVVREFKLNDNTTTINTREATMQDELDILKAERQALVELDLHIYDRYMNIVATGKYNKYKSRSTEILNSDFGIKYYYKMLDLKFNSDNIELERDYLLENKSSVRSSVNGKILERIGNQSVNEYNKALQFVSDYISIDIDSSEQLDDSTLEFIPNNKHKLKLVEGYLNSMSKINNKLIRLSNDDSQLNNED